MTDKQFLKLIGDVKYKSVHILAMRNLMGIWELRFADSRPDVTAPEGQNQYAMFVQHVSLTSEFVALAKPKDILLFIKGELIQFEMHELEEQFQYKGKRIFNPHKKEQKWLRYCSPKSPISPIIGSNTHSEFKTKL